MKIYQNSIKIFHNNRLQTEIEIEKFKFYIPMFVIEFHESAHQRLNKNNENKRTNIT